MAVYTPLPGATVEAFQWLGDPLADYNLPGWAVSLALHAPSDSTLHVPCWNGTFGAKVGDWIVKDSLGNVSVVPDAVFAASYNVDDVAVEETRKSAVERRAEAAEAKALAAEERARVTAAKAQNRTPPAPATPVKPTAART